MNIRKLIASLVLAFALLPVAFASTTEHKGTKIVNINKANAATFAAYFKRVGPNKAEAIVKYRRVNGKFKSIADLNNVPGIGEETFKGIKKNASLSRGESTPPKGFRMAETSGNTRSTKKPKRTKSGDSNSSTERRSRRSSDSGDSASRRSGSSSNSGSSRRGDNSGSTPRKKNKAKDGDKKKKRKAKKEKKGKSKPKK